MTDQTYVLPAVTCAKFRRVSTATLRIALFKCGLRDQFIQDVVPVSAKPDVMVGQAFALR